MMTPIRWINLAALVLSAIGLLVSWIGIGSIVSQTGINLSDGKFFGVVLILTALVGLWYVLRTNRFASVLLLVGWIGLLSIVAYEIVNVSSVRVPIFGSADVGAGLYLDAVGCLVGLITAMLDVSLTWGGHGGTRVPWLVWATGLIALLAVIGAGIGGHNHGSHYNGFNNLNNSGNTGSGNTGSGNTGSGNTGDT